MRVLAREILNLELVAISADAHRSNPQNTYPALTKQVLSDIVSTMRNNAGQAFDEVVLFVNPKRVDAFTEGEFSLMFDMAFSNVDIQGGYFGRIMDCSLIANESVPDDVISSAQVQRNGEFCQIVALNTNYIAE